MTFVRPRTGDQSDPRNADWLTIIGAADERDGRAVDSLARSLRLIANGWALLAVTRFIFILYFLGGNLGTALFMGAPVQVALAGTLLCDLLITGGMRIDPIRTFPPNHILALQIPTVLIASALSVWLSTMILPDSTKLIAATLGPALVAVGLFGRRRALSVSYCIGITLGALAGHGAPALIAAALMFTIASLVGMAIDYGIARRSSAFHATRSSKMTADLARALLADFERLGRGWFWETDRQGKLTYVSETMARQMGGKGDDLVGRSLASLIATPSDAIETDGQRSLAFHLSARTGFTEIPVKVAHAAEERWWSISGQPIVTPFGQFLGFRGSGSDLTAMRRSQAEIERLANFDSLTGLANRVHMMTTLEQTLTSRHGLPGECALFLIDLDRFKEVNDTMGHPAGDALLRQVAQRLLRLVDVAGKVGRLGGDEFKIVLPGLSDQRQITRLASGIIHALSQPYTIDGSQVVIGASIGIALAPGDGDNAETLIRNADLALYAAKAEGRGVFRNFAPAMHAEADDRRQLEHDLRQAVAEGGLQLEYQPIVSASTERITGFEALVRWNHPVRGSISPTLFVPLAEETGLIGPLGEWVMRTACADAARWPEGTRVAVNVSPIQFANAGLPLLVMSALANAGLSANRLELEITEGVFLADGADTDGMFGALKRIGVRLALDDFGTGYSALGYLRTAPFDKIKIDQSFVRGAAIKGSRNAAIVKSIVSLADALGMDTTAEGAETLDELGLIRSLGCSHVQGYVYGRPLEAEHTLALLDAQNGYAEARGPKASREPRMAMLRSVMLRHGGNDYPARIRNISRMGAMVDGVSDVPVGTVFEVELARDYVMRGTCRWSQGDRMGLEFAQAIEVDRVRAPIEKERILTDVPDFYRENWREAS